MTASLHRCPTAHTRSIPFGLATIAAVVSCWPEKQVAHFFSWTAFRRIDFIGGTTLLCASGFLVFGIEQGGGGMSGWSDPAVIVSLVIASVSWALFVAWETALSFERLAAKIEPMFPIRLIRHRVYMGGLA
jgi:hypothetical protein